MNKYPTLYAVLAAQAAPDAWWSKMFQEIKKKKPSLNEQKIREAIGDIWYQKLDESKRVEIRRKFHANVSAAIADKIVAEWAGNYGDLSAEEELEEKFEDLKAIHPEWSDSDTAMYLMNRAARYTPQWEWLEKKLEEIKKIQGSLTLADMFPELAALIEEIAEDPRTKEATAGAWKFCGKCVRMTPHDEKGNCKEH